MLRRLFIVRLPNFIVRPANTGVDVGDVAALHEARATFARRVDP
jgi:hypothetical protein